jgi:hypothetical protein
MWIYSTKGFFSIVQNRDNPDQVIIRARLKKDIDDLKRVFDSLKLRTTKIAENSRADYRYRFTADRMDWITVMIRLMVDLHYTNFKDEVYNVESGEVRERRHDAYLRIWAIMCNLQEFEVDLEKKKFDRKNLRGGQNSDGH